MLIFIKLIDETCVSEIFLLKQFSLSLGDEDTNDSIAEIIPSSISIPLALLSEDTAFLQTAYSTSILFQLVLPETNNESTIVIDTEVIGVTLANQTLTNTSVPVVITLQSNLSRFGEVIKYIAFL